MTTARDTARTRLRPFSEKLVGRDEILATLVRSVCGQRGVTLSGVAGVGKTALAQVAVQRLTEAGVFPGGVFWAALRGVTQERHARAAVEQHLAQSNEPCFVVLDGADALAGNALVEGLLTRYPQLHLLLVVRQAPRGKTTAAVVLEPLAPSEARRLLVSSVSHSLEADEATALVRLLDSNPLALRFMAALLEVAELSALQHELERRLLAAKDTTPLLLARDILLEALPEPARRLLAMLSFFATGARAEDLRLVGGEGGAAPLEVLLRSGLVVEEEERYSVVVDLPETPPQAALGPTGVLLALALGHLRSGQTDAAFDLAERALTVARTAQNREGFARALLVLGRVTLTEEPARAALLLEEAATHFDGLKDLSSQAQVRFWQGRAFNQLEEPEAALAAFHEAQALRATPPLEALFSALQTHFTAQGGGSLLSALESDTASLRESGLLSARVRLGLPGK